MRSETNTQKQGFIVHVQGLVQGVGFRPFVYRLAHQMALTGTVDNRTDGVFVNLHASKAQVDAFILRMKQEAPPASSIYKVQYKTAHLPAIDGFEIVKSKQLSKEVTQVSPDIGVCKDCLEDMETQNHRLDYPFINCTNCGPRYSIIQALPYDRPKTTMKDFNMCPTCHKEYTNVLDRRFHAQPVACTHCGPQYTLVNGDEQIKDLKAILDELKAGLSLGKVYAIKGIGGYHLMCDARNAKAIDRLRELKHRDDKPLALMAKSIEDVRAIATMNEKEKEVLQSWQQPIVLLKSKNTLPNGLNNGLSSIGVMLPYMPFHYLLFKALPIPFLVFTSGNLSSDPILIDNHEALAEFGDVVDGVITHNRDIHNRVDDSVVRVINNRIMLMRRSRGYAPKPVQSTLNTEGILATGAELSGTFCMGKQQMAIQSQYQGDLKGFKTLQFYEESYHRLAKLFKFKPQLLVSDLHPNYHSTKFGEKLSEEHKIKQLYVQHHHAHVAASMYENKLDEPVLGVCWDGLGLGTDGSIWGAEFMQADLLDFKRMFHFEYVPMPGGDMASKQPWRMALSYLYHVYGEESMDLGLPFLKRINSSQQTGIYKLIKQNINAPRVSSAGRLFDAIAALLNVCLTNNYQAQAPMQLEALVDAKYKGTYSYDILDGSISFKPCIKAIVGDIQNGENIALIATKFHRTLVQVCVDVIKLMREKTGLNKVVLAGGSFQNEFLTKTLMQELPKLDFELFLPNEVPINDQGIALGQLAIAAKRREQNLI